MQSDYAQSLSHDNWMDLTEEPSTQTEAASATGLMNFHSHFVGAMELMADAETVEQYLNVHRGWFCRCAHPMAVEPVGENGYLLTVGRYGSFGFEVEPKIGLHLLPPDEQGVYRIETIPGVTPEDNGYKVDFQAALELVDRAADRSQQSDASLQSSTPQNLTHVEWTLDLNVALLFPKFIRRLPHSLIQGTGDRLLAQIVRQVSRRLTAKVQDDFHSSLNR